IRDHTVLVNPFETPSATRENHGPLRYCLQWLEGGGLLAMFPAGEVAHLHWEERSITDPPWKTAAARLALRTQCAVVPAFFEGLKWFVFSPGGRASSGPADHQPAA